MDAEAFGIQRRANRDRLVINDDFTFIACPGAAQHRHQRGFPRAVGSGQGMHRSAAQAEVHLRQSINASKGEANRAQLEMVNAHL